MLGEVKLNYLSRQYFVTMGLFLMAVLLPFNTSPSLTFRDLSEVTQLDPKDLARHVQQLVDIKLLNTTAVNIIHMAAAEVWVMVRHSYISLMLRIHYMCDCDVFQHLQYTELHFIVNRTCNTMVTGSHCIRYAGIWHDPAIFPVIGPSVLSAANQNA